MKKLLKGILAATMIASMALAMAGCADKPAEETTEEPAKEAAEGDGGVLVMATNAEFPPYEFYKGEGQEVVGIDAEIAQAIAETMGKTLQIEDMAFDSIIPAILSGKADFGAAGMTVNEERLANVDFSDTYIKASQAIIIKADNTEITNADALKGKSIGVQLGTTGDIYATDITDKVERFNKGFEAVQAVSQGKIDAVMIDDQVAKALAAKNADVKVLAEPFTTEEYAIAVKKGNTELVEQINAALAELKESGKLQEIIDKYISAE